MNRLTTLTELGPDTDALREEDKAGLLFDMGLGTLQADICIRTHDAGLIETLRVQSGRSLFDPGNPAMGAIVTAGPHCVFMARFGRCEVYQPIPPADGKRPEGPHTHALPKLLRSGRTHAANELMPDGFVPCAHLVPAHPIKDAMGQRRPWDAQAHASFQNMLSMYGDARLRALKTGLAGAMASVADGDAVPVPDDRFARHAVKVPLRQTACTDRSTTIPEGWLSRFDSQGADEDQTAGQADDYGHA